MLEYDSPGLAWTQQHSTYIIRQSSRQLGQPNAAKPFSIVLRNITGLLKDDNNLDQPTQLDSNTATTKPTTRVVVYNKSQIISTNILDRKRYIPDIEQIKYRNIQRMYPTILATTGIST